MPYSKYGPDRGAYRNLTNAPSQKEYCNANRTVKAAVMLTKLLLIYDVGWPFSSFCKMFSHSCFSRLKSQIFFTRIVFQDKIIFFTVKSSLALVCLYKIVEFTVIIEDFLIAGKLMLS